MENGRDRRACCADPLVSLVLHEVHQLLSDIDTQCLRDNSFWGIQDTCSTGQEGESQTHGWSEEGIKKLLISVSARDATHLNGEKPDVDVVPREAAQHPHLATLDVQAEVVHL